MRRLRWWLLGLLAAAGLMAAASATGRVRPPLPRLPLHWPAKPPEPVLVSVPAITTNLAGADAGHFAQVAITLELRDKSVAAVFDQRQAAVYDAVIADLRAESLDQLGGDSGMRALRRLVRSSLDRVLGGRDAVQAVFFTQFVVQ